MARIRYIKPGFFHNENLAELKPLARLMFAGLWCHADREGRLEDRPARLRKEILGYDNCNANALLQTLADAGFIIRYKAADGTALIQVSTWHKHQRPHKRELPSTYPAPDGYVPEHDPGTAQDEPGQEPIRPGMGNGELGMGNGELGTDNGITPKPPQGGDPLNESCIRFEKSQIDCRKLTAQRDTWCPSCTGFQEGAA